MWTDRQWRDRRVGAREILWSWMVVALIALGVGAWDGLRALLPELGFQGAPTGVRSER